MPIYEYQCQKCKTTFEVMHAVSAKPPKTCQSNGCKGKVSRLVSASGFILKGSGWYTSDYPSEARKKGWEQEHKQASGGADAAPATDKAAPAPEKKATAEKSASKPAPQKPAQKNPYSGKKGNKTKSSK